MRTPRLAGVHGAIVIAGVLAFAALTAVAQPAAAEGGTPAAGGTAAATGTATSTATPIVFEVSDEGKAQLLRLLRSRLLPPPARTTLAALLEQEGVQHEVLAKLFDRPRHCDNGHGKDGEHSKRCRAELPQKTLPCAGVTPAATSTAGASDAASATATTKPASQEREHCAKPDKAEKPDRAEKPAKLETPAKLEKKGTPVALSTVAPEEACRLALAAGSERPEKLLERCAMAMKGNRELAASVCARVNATEAPTKVTKELQKYCAKLLAVGTPKVKPTEPARVKPVEKPGYPLNVEKPH